MAKQSLDYVNAKNVLNSSNTVPPPLFFFFKEIPSKKKRKGNHVFLNY